MRLAILKWKVLKNSRQKVIGEIYVKHISNEKKFTVTHFSETEIERQTMYNIINKINSGKSLDRAIANDRKARKMTKSKKVKLKQETVGKVSQYLKKESKNLKYFS